MSIRISICIPLYNGSRYLRQCIDSCLAQTFNDYEIVICDDGSTDDGPSIVAEYLKTTDKIRFISSERNLGLSGNWNRCIREARGEWIKFLFQDDYMAPDCLQDFISAATNETVLLVSRRHFVFEYQPSEKERDDYERKSRLFDHWSGRNVSHISAERIARYAALHMTINFIGEPSLTMFRKNDALKADGFNETLIQLCDLDFFLRLASANGLQYVPKNLCSFRLHHSTATNVNLSESYFRVRFLEPVLLAARMLGDKNYTTLRAHWNQLHIFVARLFLKTRMAEAIDAAKTDMQLRSLQELKNDPAIWREARPRAVHRLAIRCVRLKRHISRLLRG